MAALLARIGDIRFLRYVLASGAALAADMACFAVLLMAGAAAVPASAVGFATGILTHWLLSSRKVFAGRVPAGSAARRRQKALFVLAALIGLTLTTAIVAMGEALGMDPLHSKLVAIGMCFPVTWLVLSQFVFNLRAGCDAASR